MTDNNDLLTMCGHCANLLNNKYFLLDILMSSTVVYFYKSKYNWWAKILILHNKICKKGYIYCFFSQNSDLPWFLTFCSVGGEGMRHEICTCSVYYLYFTKQSWLIRFHRYCQKNQGTKKFNFPVARMYKQGSHFH